MELVAVRYERASLMVTSNKPFGRWGETFGDDVVAAAMIDRLVHQNSSAVDIGFNSPAGNMPAPREFGPRVSIAYANADGQEQPVGEALQAVTTTTVAAALRRHRSQIGLT